MGGPIGQRRCEAPLSVLPDISPSRGEISRHAGFRQRCRKGEAPKPPISPLEGEMSGRTERGAK
ncbi:MAG: ABC transporter ATP-binding protein, partial [Mesorhizobium sp.]